MRRNWKLVVCFTLLTTGVTVLGLPEIAKGVDYNPVTISQLEEVNADGSSHWVDLHPTNTLYPVEFMGVVINKPSDMLDYTYDADSNPSPQFQVYVQALPEGTYGGYDVAAGDLQGTALYMRMTIPWNASQNYTESEWASEMTRIGASTLDYGDVVLVQANAPGMFYNGKFNINERHLKSSDYDFSISVIDQVTPTASSVTMSDLKDASDNYIFDSTRATGCERYQGSLVQIDNLLLEDSADWGLYNTVTVSEGDRTFPMLLGLDEDLLSIDAASLTYRPFSITAILDQESADYQAGYRFWLTDAAQLTPALLGDANCDNKVDGSDVTILAQNWQVGVSDGQKASWYMGDFNGDGKVDGSDVTILAGNWQAGVNAAETAVPEPSMIVLLLGVLTGMLVVRRRK